ncbi:MAG: HXXEE domain-containing protein [Sphingomonas sp.]
MTTARARWLTPLAGHWVVSAVYTGAVLLLLAPLLRPLIGDQAWLIYLCGPAYMAHQVEEHWGDRFRRFVNDRLGGGRDVLTARAVWWINLPGVWGVNITALYAAMAWGAGAGLAAPYLMLVNALGHGGAALRFGYNPGLATALLLFVPLGAIALVTINATAGEHAIGLAIAILIHLAIIALIITRRRLLRP